MDLVSIIVPFLNEKDCIVQYCNFINNFSNDKPFEVEVIFVDDGSTDNTVDVITAYNFTNCQSVKVIKLSKNYGSHAAIRAGIFHASGDYTTFMGVDLEEPDDMVSIMHDHIVNGLDAVYMDRKSASHVSAMNRALSLIYAALMRRFAVKNYSSGGTFSVMFNRKIKNYLNSNIELNSSLILQILNAGFKSTTVEVDIKSRVAGVSKWTFSKKVKIFIDSFVAFSFAPIRFVSIAGITMSLMGFLFGVNLVINWMLNPDYLPAGYTTLVSLLLIGFGITNISLGIIAEYLWRTYDAARGRPAFIISEINELKQAK